MKINYDLLERAGVLHIGINSYASWSPNEIYQDILETSNRFIHGGSEGFTNAEIMEITDLIIYLLDQQD